MVERRAPKGELWKESARRYNTAREHEEPSTSTCSGLASEHEVKAQRLSAPGRGEGVR